MATAKNVIIVTLADNWVVENKLDTKSVAAEKMSKIVDEYIKNTKLQKCKSSETQKRTKNMYEVDMPTASRSDIWKRLNSLEHSF